MACLTGSRHGPERPLGTSGPGRHTGIAASSCIGSGVYPQACTSSSEVRRSTSAYGPRSVPTSSGGCPEYLPLFELVEGDFREHAQAVSCHQEIAGNDAFSLGMIADFTESIRATGAWWYRKLFWESGITACH